MTIFKDALGKPNAQATISVFGSKYGKPGTGYLSLTSTSNCQPRKWSYISYDVSHIVAEMEADGWECIVTKDGYNAPRINCTHKETQTLIDDATKKVNDKFKNAKKGFIRFGKCPKNGQSTNYRDNTLEAGVSVFEAEFVGKEYRLLLTDYLEVTYVAVADRPAYRVYGEIVGAGSDGEPVLKVSKSIKL